VFVADNGILLNRLPHPQFILPDLEIDPERVFRCLSNLKPKLSSGPDGYPKVLLKNLAGALSEPLSKLFNASLLSGRLPSDWKLAKVIPKHKKGDKSSVTNYRPISQLSNFGLVLESIVCTHLDDFLEGNNLISANQYGFRKSRSTILQLLEILNDWTKALDSKRNLDVIYLDIQKAFDSVSHAKLVQVLESFGINRCLLTWMTNYLTGRSQFVQIGNAKSSLCPVVSGVPQGSILGPKMFLTYINDVDTVSQMLIVKLFADDAKLYSIFQDQLDTVNIQEDLNSVSAWAESRQLTLAFQKCVCMHLGSSNPTTDYILGNSPLAQVNTLKDLGVWFTSSVSFSTQCSEIARTGFMKVNVMYNNFISRSPSLLLKLYVTFIRPGLEYATEIWSPHLIRDIELVERVQRLFTRRLPCFQSLSYTERLAKLGLKSLSRRRIERDLVMVYKITHGLVNINQDLLLTFATENRTRGHNFKLAVERTSLNLRKFFFSNRIVNTWNNLDSSIVNAPSLIVFKNRISSLDM
jgi:hypothetical protein